MNIMASDFEIAECANTDDSGRNINLVIFNQDVAQVQVLAAPGVISKVLSPVRVVNQQDTEATFYSIPGSTGLMDVQNTVLKDLWGIVHLENGTYFCD